MKTRKGFVSNSSSSSFIIHWDIKDNNFEEKENVKRAIMAILDADFYGRYTSKEYDKEIKTGEGLGLDNDMISLVNHIVQRTKYIKGKGYETVFWTSMTNDFRDYGEEVMKFVMALTYFNLNEKISNILEVDYEIEFDY